MTKFTSIRIHRDFKNGTKNSVFATDWVNLSTPEKLKIATFVSHLSQNTELHGRNKESWIDNDFNVIADASLYEKANAWHYHCGPTLYSSGSIMTKPSLLTNMDGDHTYECLHYLKINSEILTLAGFSKNHVPFLNYKGLLKKSDHPFFQTFLKKYNSDPY